ncbi:probable receptor-like protein kinase At5g39030 [Arabidopsis lyrata subsp. lyrata]|uniref:probable receptor-like protein kinase At5g39030 n=1 Tax=Arabidopsis lyrata subsp. lyrata TaxID=81972 RepID=UPI000A29AA75|nr:probable receptor-like protein kinase At5g39030 [Arabidopsis lyrata subsp. lyrata]|eukprot:XP_020872917.1 probable receptor-like protein kinase At5g39030 [Arabidopsis lyrata subsp. lyrata]
MICFICFVFSILVSVSGGGGEEATAPYKPADVYLINCGTNSSTIDNSGRTWTPEQKKILPSNSDNASFSSLVSYKESRLLPQVLYMTARIFRYDFTYSIPTSPGWKFIRLHFYPAKYLYGPDFDEDFDAASSFFSVSVNCFTLLTNFSADLTMKASKKSTLIKEFIVPVYQSLNLTFRPSKNSLAFVNGIEIVSMPDRFYSKGGFDNMITNVGSNVDFEIDNSTAFETVYRVNVGGQMVGEVHDWGMFRRWLSDDDEFLQGGINSYLPDVLINYTEKTPAYVAPASVYATWRSMGNAQASELNLNFNLTWLFTVDAGFNYLVRLHFCETLQQVNQRVFSIFLGSQMAKKEMDVIGLSGGSLIPMYLDFRVYVDSESGPRPDLRLDLYPLKEIKPMYYDAILNGVEILKLNTSYGNLAGPNPNPPLSSNLTQNRVKQEMKGKFSHLLVKIFIAAGSGIGLATFIVVLMFSMRQMKRKNKKEESVVMFKKLLIMYTYAELKKITKSFSYIIGKGGFGTVYGGNLSNGRKVAVKVLKDLKGSAEDFINEVASMSQTSHVNIVSLLGFCYEGSKRAIVYEFLENGSLDQFISRNKSLTHDVTMLYGIALGIARGLEYLHYGCKTRIVHFDIKPQNILLDGNLCPKVSDFGLAKLCEKRESVLSLMDTRGTIGYIAPEVFSRMYGRVSHKSDVYSYGMLVLDMIGARNKEIVATIDSAASSTYFPDWIYKDLEDGEQTWIFGDEITKEEKEIARKMILVGLWCIQPCPSDRPPMIRVVEMMEGSLDALDIPPKPSMHISNEVIPESSSLSDDEEAG